MNGLRRRRLKLEKEKVLVTGAKGQLGWDVVREYEQRGYTVYGLGRDELDITDAEACQKAAVLVKPKIAIHCAAYTKVDNAEMDADEAYRINAYGTRNVAAAAAGVGAKLVGVSTDYVFNGKSTVPYDEFCAVDPINVYGRSKWAGEQLIRQVHARHYIVRTSWVYGAAGNNFVKTMLRLGAERPMVQVVRDQIGSPTYTADLAKSIADLTVTERYGTYHICGGGHCSWHEFAEAIFGLAGLSVQTVPILSKDYPQAAARPGYSVLNCRSLRLNGLAEPRPWRDALADFLSSYKGRKSKSP
ncbi:dTDP-4-dehydrorhamnose reductase [Paenibacillus sp. CAA11]|uniref:dTDP-4-dehydrorhamnose reductase n=1 Tax=Paenibacillus sp. CAA11 TaxID=1532905 RepID=UPI000D3BE96E|nr:dTDP-4-dehydrorhamnose reductase [Paenibacillus sp. CAA11]AWB43615.1 dTDP-4-dehydrorhamnose reductase [Paenibacillus sp. CAA11]